MALSLTREKLIELVSGTSPASSSKISFSQLEISPDLIKGGELFVAGVIPGTDPQQSAQVAAARGAAIILHDQAEKQLEYSAFIEPERLILVASVSDALRILAQYWRSQHKIPIVLVSGALGKTSIKEICVSILLRSGLGSFSLASENLPYQLAYHLCRLSPEHSWMVLETRAGNELENQTVLEMAKPSVLVLAQHSDSMLPQCLNLIEGLASDCVLVADRGDIQLLGQAAQRKPPVTVKTYGRESDADLQLLVSQGLGLDGVLLEFNFATELLKLRLPILGEQHALNTMAAVLAAQIVSPSVSPETLRLGIEQFRAPLLLSRQLQLRGGSRVVDDSYECSLQSMLAILRVAAELKQDGAAVGLVLAGNFSSDESKIVSELRQLTPAFVIVLSSELQQSLKQQEDLPFSVYTAENAIAAGHIATKLNFDILLVKGPPELGLNETVRVIKERLSE